MLPHWTLRLSFIIFFKILSVTCVRESSLTFVIDDTRSMWDDIDQVRQAAADIMNIVTAEKASEIKDVVLVTFNDPEVVLRIKTSSKEEFLEALGRIVVHNVHNYDCPEYALTGIKTALEESRQGSYIYVFTDASAKDYNKYDYIKSLCEKKQSQVVFVLTGDCHNPHNIRYQVYHEIAKASNGQVFRIDKDEVKDVLETIKETVKGQKVVVTSQVIPATFNWYAVPFEVDDKTEYVIVSTSGKNVDLIIMDRSTRGGHKMTTEQIMWKSSGKVSKFDAPKPGTYYAWVKGETDISIVVYARTDFTFNHGFSAFVPKSLSDTSKQPIADQTHHLSISVTDPDHTVDIESAEILDMNEKVIYHLPLKKANGGFYITDRFVSPSSMFKIQVIGKNRRTGNTIKRISKTAIEPQIPPTPDSKAPEVTITEGTKVDIDYSGEISLTCKVSAYPKPNIVWTTVDGTVLSSKSSEVELPYDYISYLKLTNVKKPETFYCTASNNKAKNKFSRIDVNIRSPFRVISAPAGTTQTKYGQVKKLRCDVSSLYPMEVIWNTPLKSSDYSLSSDKKELTIKSTSIEAQGQYTCETKLISDPTINHVIATNVVISDLAPPTIINASPNSITVTQGKQVGILCETGGIPRPTISWQVKKNDDNAFRPLLVSGEKLIINSASLTDSGEYRCTAKNARGQNYKTTKLIVLKAPECSIDEGATVTVPYGSNNEFKCRIIGYPLPKIVWRDSKGHELSSKDVIKNNEVTSSVIIQNIKVSNTYSCNAENIVGKEVSKIDVSVTSPIVVDNHPPATTTSPYGVPTDITCNIKSKFSMNIKWFHHSASKKTEIHTSGKYTISPNRNTLRILSTELDMIGKYTCEASLVSDGNQKVAFTTDVKINNLSPPMLQSTGSQQITVQDKEKATIPCKIVGGTPAPTVSWQVMRKNDNVFRDLPDSSQELTVASASLADAGQYRCIAKNTMGQTDKTTELIVLKAPECSIDEGATVTVPYGSNNEFKCRIIGYPLPKIVWRDSKGNELSSKDVIKNNEVTSSVIIQNIKVSNTYSCNAENIVGKEVSKIDVSVTSPIVVDNHPPATTTSPYGVPTDITCNIKSKFSMNIKWFHHSASKKTEIHTSGKYTISPNGNTLRILSTELDMIGKYTCEASLVSDGNQKVAFTTDVKINNLSPPMLQNTGSQQITVQYKKKATIPCKIVGGTPAPTVSWQVMRKDDNVFRDLPDSSQELTVASASLADAGQYRCIAKNAMGQTDKTTELIVLKAPECSIDEGATVTVPYGSNNEFKCRIIGYPLPKIVWRDSKGNELSSKDVIKNNEVTSNVIIQNIKVSNTYSCNAENIVGKEVSKIDVSVTSPIVVDNHPPATTTSPYGVPTDITCNIKSKFSMNIKWFHHSASKKTEIHTSGKYTISPNRNTLRILSTELGMIGKYTCEASLVSDGNQKVAFTTDVKINNLSPPMLQSTGSQQITVQDKKKATIPCKIVGGTPAPTVSWQVMRKDDNVFRDLPDSSQELTVASASLADAGQYRCIAKNTMGQSDKTTELIVLKAPECSIDEGATVTVPYGSNNEFKCRIIGYPLPKIVWRDSKGNELSSKDVIKNNEVTSSVIIQNIKVSNTYSCNAENIVGKEVSKIDVSVTSPIVVDNHPPATTTSPYGVPTDITCNIKSKFSMNKKWFHHSASKKTEIHTSGKYTISPNGNTLRILSTELDMIGKYTCEASLVSDGNQKVAFTTDVKINNLSPPMLQNTGSQQITVQDKKKATIPCKIVGGTPAPTVSWQVMRKDDNVFRDLPNSSQEVTVTSASLADAGQYRCIVKNAMGQTDKTTELIVNKAPEGSIDEGAKVTVPYRSNKEFKCRIVAYPLPKIVWRDSKGNELSSKETITIHETVSQLKVDNIKAFDTYSCYAENNMGKTVSSVQVSVTPAINFPTHLPGTIGVKYRAPTNIVCDAKSSFAMKIKWFYQKDGKSSARSEIQTSSQFIISPDGRMLNIVSTGLDLVGKYTCEASLVSDENENKSYTVKVEINDLKAPVITDGDKTLTVMNGQKMTASCKVNGVPPPKVTWEFKPKGSNVFASLQTQGEQISKPNIGYESAGSYKCTATNAVGTKSSIIDINVHGEPKITNVDSVYYGVTGDWVLKIPCEVIGVPEPTITWKHDGKYVTSDTKITLDKNTLFIKNPTEKDSSNFTCEANNIYGKATKIFEAEVSDFVDFSTNLNDYIYLKPGESTDIKCRLPHSDPKSVRWYVNTDKNYVTPGTTYSIKNADFPNDGNYTCRVNTDQGSESLNYVVDVGYKPSFTRPLSSPIINWNGDKKDTLDCNVRAKPDGKVEWFYNGKVLDSKVSELPISGWGDYTCKVTNVHGSVLQTFNVTSKGCVVNRTINTVQNTPLLLNDKSLSWPTVATENEFYVIDKKYILKLACSTKDQPINTFRTHPNTKVINAECYQKDQFIVDGKTYQFHELQCQEYVKPSLVDTKKPCLKNGEIIEVGFRLDSGFLGVYEICYSAVDHKTLYAKVLMSEVNIGNIVGPSFKLNPGIKTSKHNSDIVKCRYNQRRLVSPVDVAFGPAQISTLSDKYNAVPVHEPCDRSSRMPWSDVEGTIQYAMFIKDEFTVWTGASNYDVNGIPRYLWKLAMLDDETFEAIVYVNAPNPDSKDILCSGTSQIFTDIIDYQDQYTYTCQIDEFLTKFNFSESDFGIELN